MPYNDCLETSKYLMNIIIELEVIYTREIIRNKMRMSKFGYLGGIRDNIEV